MNAKPAKRPPAGTHPAVFKGLPAPARSRGFAHHLEFRARPRVKRLATATARLK